MSGLIFNVRTEGLDDIPKRIKLGAIRAEHNVAVQAMKDTDPFVPALTGSLSERTRVDQNRIIYPGPYARYLYYGKVMVNSATGKGPMHYIDKKGNEQIRFPKGSKLVPIDRDLKINRSVHHKAQSHWFEASKAQNKEKWVRAAKEAVKDDFRK